MLSIFDIYKIGVGPSSSHTNGPMIAGNRFLQKLITFCEQNEDGIENHPQLKIKIDLHGSLALTGKGHQTDQATIFGLMGYLPDRIDLLEAKSLLTVLKMEKILYLNQQYGIEFDWDTDIYFDPNRLAIHENALTLTAFLQDEIIMKETFYSVGGGFIYTEEELGGQNQNKAYQVPYDFKNAFELLAMADAENKSLFEIIWHNELVFRSATEIFEKARQIWTVISNCIESGIQHEGVLPGGLNVQRRASKLYKHLISTDKEDELSVMDWINVYAFAVSEENASGGQVVTSPTNGAAGVIPSVLKYYDKFVGKLTEDKLVHFLMISGAIGYLYKLNASISGAEVGCQGEIGVSSSMAAAGLAALKGGTNQQIAIAAEIAMEHSLGMTCDPIAGLVQVPCIERNAMGALKAINAARMALQRHEKTVVSLDSVIETMYKTGKDMDPKYRETSLGGLAIIHISPCE